VKLYIVSILTGIVAGPAAQLVCYVLRTRPGSATSIILAAIVGAAVGVVLCRATTRPTNIEGGNS